MQVLPLKDTYIVRKVTFSGVMNIVLVFEKEGPPGLEEYRWMQ